MTKRSIKPGKGTDPVLDNEFYQGIEPGIRDAVRLLRDNGINTTCSCEHEMYIQFEGDSHHFDTVRAIHHLLFSHGWRNYLITTRHGQPPDGFHYNRGEIRFGEWMWAPLAVPYYDGKVEFGKWHD